MIELKISTTSAAVLHAIANVFTTMANEIDQAPTRDVLPPVVTEQIYDEEYDDADDVEQVAADLPPPPPTNGPAATIHALASAGVELDTAGYPWDHRIHSSTKSKIKDGTWKLARGVDQAVVDQVRGEFRQNMAAPITVAPALAAPAAVVPPAPVVDPVPSQPAPAPAPAIAAAAPAAERPTNPGLLFTSTLAKYAEAEKAGKVAAGSGDAWAKEAGLANMASLITRPDLCGQFYDQLVALLGG